jgi:plastocyanin
MSIRLAVATGFLLGIIVAAQAATTMAVGQKGMKLTQSSASLAKGDRIVFVNDDDIVHDIQIFGPGEDDSSDLGLQKPGAQQSYAFDKAGAYRIRCNIHPSMKMAVTVD